MNASNVSFMLSIKVDRSVDACASYASRDDKRISEASRVKTGVSTILATASIALPIASAGGPENIVCSSSSLSTRCCRSSSAFSEMPARSSSTRFLITSRRCSSALIASSISWGLCITVHHKKGEDGSSRKNALLCARSACPDADDFLEVHHFDAEGMAGRDSQFSC